MLGVPYDFLKNGEYLLYVLMLMIIQLFVTAFSCLSMLFENGPLCFYGFLGQILLVARSVLLFGNYIDGVNILPVILQVVFLFPHCFFGSCSRWSYGAKRFDLVSKKEHQKLFSQWKRIEALLYFDCLSSFIAVVLSLVLVNFTVQFLMVGGGYLLISSILICCYNNFCYHEQWKCVTMFYMLYQTYLVLYGVYKIITIISGYQIDELAPVWDDNEYEHLIWVLLNLGSSAFLAIFIRICSFAFLLGLMLKWMRKSNKGDLTIALKNRKPYQGPHWYCCEYCLLFGHCIGECCECECCDKLSANTIICEINVAKIAKICGHCYNTCDFINSKCGPLRGCFGLKGYDKIAIKKWILDLRGERTLEMEIEAIGEDEDEKKDGWCKKCGKVGCDLFCSCRYCTFLYKKATGQYDSDDDDDDEEVMDKLYDDETKYSDDEIELDDIIFDTDDEKRKKRKLNEEEEEKKLSMKLAVDSGKEIIKYTLSLLKKKEEKEEEEEEDNEVKNDEDEELEKDGDEDKKLAATMAITGILKNKVYNITLVGGIAKKVLGDNKKKKEEENEEEEKKENEEGNEEEGEEVKKRKKGIGGKIKGVAGKIPIVGKVFKKKEKKEEKEEEEDNEVKNEEENKEKKE